MTHYDMFQRHSRKLIVDQRISGGLPAIQLSLSLAKFVETRSDAYDSLTTPARISYAAVQHGLSSY